MATKPNDFFLSDIGTVTTLCRRCENEYSKDEIVSLLHEARKWVRRAPFVYRDAAGAEVQPPDVVRTVFGPSAKRTFYSMKKDCLALALAYYMADMRNVDPEQIGPDGSVEKLAGIIAKDGVADYYEVTEICGKTAIHVRNHFWGSDIHLSSELKGFSVWLTDYTSRLSLNDEIYVSMPGRLIERYIREAYPAGPDNLDTLPDGADGGFLVIDRRNRAPELISLASTMLESGAISTASNKLMGKGDLKKFMKLAGGAGDAPTGLITPLDDGEEEYSLDGMTLMAALFDEYALSNVHTTSEQAAFVASNDPADKVRTAVVLTQAYRECPQLVRLFLPGITGISKPTVHKLRIRIMADLVKDFLAGFPGPGWRSVSNLITEIYIMAAQSRSELLADYAETWPRLAFRNGNDKPVSLSPGYALRELTFRFIRCYLLYLSALGVIEIAVGAPAAGRERTYERLEYLRLTDLGLYALGIGPKPDLSVRTQFDYRFELVDNPLIVVSLDRSNPYDAWLDRIGVRSGNRWIVTAESFLKECKSSDDIEALTDDFRRFICAEPPAVWSDFFERLKRNAGTGSLKTPEDDYVMYDVNPANSDLLAFLTSDAEIRRLVVRAEGYRIMVRAVDMALFRKAMRRGGFLV